jgi:xanthosine utilization system XapX-like protein
MKKLLSLLIAGLCMWVIFLMDAREVPTPGIIVIPCFLGIFSMAYFVVLLMNDINEPK